MTQESDVYVPIVSPDTLMTISDAVKAGVGMTTAYDMFGPTVPACMSVANIILMLHGLIEETQLKFFFGLDGNSYGDDIGYGRSYSSGDGNSCGSVNGYGDGYGGYGRDTSYGYGNGDGDGNGYGYGNGDGTGYGDGNGDGTGYGDGNGNGYGQE